MRVFTVGFKAGIATLGKLQLATQLPLLTGTKIRIGRILRNEILQHFREEGPGWKPLAPATVRKKGHARILIETKDLMNSQKIEMLAQTVYVRSFAKPLVKAFAQNFGTRTIPQREIYWLSEGCVKEIERLIVIPIDRALA